MQWQNFKRIVGSAGMFELGNLQLASCTSSTSAALHFNIAVYHPDGSWKVQASFRIQNEA